MSATLDNPIAGLARRGHEHIRRHKIVCEGCGNCLRLDSQMWGCQTCGRARCWGEGPPFDSLAEPMLRCVNCDAVTKHDFLGVAGHTL